MVNDSVEIFAELIDDYKNVIISEPIVDTTDYWDKNERKDSA